MECPLCRQTPTALDANMDGELGGNNIVTVHCHIRPMEHVGITVADTTTGVKVTRLKS